jgi:hypothetical protein
MILTGSGSTALDLKVLNLFLLNYKMANEYVDIVSGWLPAGMAMPETTMPACQACGFSSSSARTGAFPPNVVNQFS